MISQDVHVHPKAPICACAYTDLDARTGEREFFNNNLAIQHWLQGRSGVYSLIHT